jgi:transcriptional regulator with XRE-family HTH domain
MKVEALKELREKYKLSQQDVADGTGIPRGRIAKWEQNKGKPKADDVKTLAKYFAKLIGEEVPNESQVNDGNDPLYSKMDKKSDKIIQDLAASSRDHAAADLKRAEAEVLREQNHKRIIDHITGHANAGSPITLETILPELQEILVDLGTGKRWKSKDDALSAVHNKLFSRLSTEKAADMKGD